jgi:hypothetical protein
MHLFCGGERVIFLLKNVGNLLKFRDFLPFWEKFRDFLPVWEKFCYFCHHP